MTMTKPPTKQIEEEAIAVQRKGGQVLKFTVVGAVVLVVGAGASLALSSYRKHVEAENAYQHAQAMFELVEKIREAPMRGSEDVLRSLSLSDAVLQEQLALDPKTPVAKSLKAFSTAVQTQVNVKLEKKNSDLDVEIAELKGRGVPTQVMFRQRQVAERIEAIDPIVETCREDVAHYLYGTASTGTCEADVKQYRESYPRKPSR